MIITNGIVMTPGIFFEPPIPTVATGGTISTVGDYKYHVFTTSGTFALTSVDPLTSFDVLLVGGGGGGGSSSGGGGGAGGVVYKTAYSLTATSYSITVGAKGIVDPNYSSTTGTNGTNTTFGSLLTAIGGGGGGGGASSFTYIGGSGGSGGGSRNGVGGAATQPASASGGYGNAGGASPVGGTDRRPCGGGGGAGTAGTDGIYNFPSNCIGGNGGDGIALGTILSDVNVGANVSGTWYIGGGGLGSAGQPGNPVWGTAGKAQASYGGGGNSEADGYNGVVVVRYKVS